MQTAALYGSINKNAAQHAQKQAHRRQNHMQGKGKPDKQKPRLNAFRRGASYFLLAVKKITIKGMAKMNRTITVSISLYFVQ